MSGRGGGSGGKAGLLRESVKGGGSAGKKEEEGGYLKQSTQTWGTSGCARLAEGLMHEPNQRLARAGGRPDSDSWNSRRFLGQRHRHTVPPPSLPLPTHPHQGRFCSRKIPLNLCSRFHTPHFQPIPAPRSQTNPAIYGLSRSISDPFTAGPRPRLNRPAQRRLSPRPFLAHSTGIFPLAGITIAFGSESGCSSLLPLSHRLRVLLLREHPQEELGRTYAFPPPPQPPTVPLSTARLTQADPLGKTSPHHLISITSLLPNLRIPARDAIHCHIVMLYATALHNIRRLDTVAHPQSVRQYFPSLRGHEPASISRRRLGIVPTGRRFASSPLRYRTGSAFLSRRPCPNCLFYVRDRAYSAAILRLNRRHSQQLH